MSGRRSTTLRVSGRPPRAHSSTRASTSSRTTPTGCRAARSTRPKRLSRARVASSGAASRKSQPTATKAACCMSVRPSAHTPGAPSPGTRRNGAGTAPVTAHASTDTGASSTAPQTETSPALTALKRACTWDRQERTLMRRRDMLKLGLAAGGAGVIAGKVSAQEKGKDLLKYLCPPDGFPDQLTARPSPAARPFAAELFVPPVKVPVPKLDPLPDPRAHQRYDEFPPKKFYEIRETEILWTYHPDPPYDKGSWSWGFDGVTPGPVYHARYGEPVLVRRYNTLPPVGQSKVTFALPSTTSHLHNGHTDSESDGNPQDWIDPGEFWDHHYCNFPSGFDPREKLTTLWYHDHRLDFTAANVYAGLSGFYF